MEADTLLGDVRRALHDGVDEDGTDHELRQVMADSYFSLSEAARPTESAIVNGAVQWMGLYMRWLRQIGTTDLRHSELLKRRRPWYHLERWRPGTTKSPMLAVGQIVALN